MPSLMVLCWKTWKPYLVSVQLAHGSSEQCDCHHVDVDDLTTRQVGVETTFQLIGTYLCCRKAGKPHWRVLLFQTSTTHITNKA